MKLEFPEGAKVGDIVSVTWHPSGAGVVVPGTYDGRLLGIKGNRLTIHFVYVGDYDPPEETIVVNLETGLDENDHVRVSDVQLKFSARTPTG
jgi:hypothetical protein